MLDGVQRLLDNIMRTITATSAMSLSATTLLGVIGGIVMLMGGHQVLSGQMTVAEYVQYSSLLIAMIAPVFQIVNIGTQLTEAVAGLDRTMEILNERDEFSDPSRTQTLDCHTWRCHFRRRNLRLRKRQTCVARNFL